MCLCICIRIDAILPVKSPLYIAFFLLLLILSSCEKFDYSPNQYIPSNKYTEINATNIAKLTSTHKDTTRIALIGDSQRFYDGTGKVVSKINTIPNIDFVIHTGDLVDFGQQDEFIWMHELLRTLNRPYISVVGNHDLIANGSLVYDEMYGDLNFSFTYNDIKFIFINTNSREFDFSPSVPNNHWLDGELSDSSNYNNAIIVSHVSPSHSDFNAEL